MSDRAPDEAPSNHPPEPRSAPAEALTPSEVPFPLRDLLGFDVERGTGVGVCRLDTTADHMNPNGVVHGAVPYALIDTAMGAATVSILDDDLICATIEIHTRYLAPCFGGRITATATVRKPGRRVVHLDAVVVDENDREIITATGSYAVLPRPDGG